MDIHTLSDLLLAKEMADSSELEEFHRWWRQLSIYRELRIVMLLWKEQWIGADFWERDEPASELTYHALRSIQWTSTT